MAKTDFTFRIKVDGEDIQVAVNDTKKLRNEVEKTGKSYRDLGRSSSDYTRNSGIIGKAQNARDFSKLSQTIGSGDSGLVGAYATLAANTFAVVAAFTALQRASSAMKVMSGLEAQGARLGLTLSITSDKIREVTNNAVSMADAMRSTAQLTAAGFGSDQIAQLSAVAKDAAGALGRDLNDAMDRLTRGVTKLEPELLDELGLMTKLEEASTNYAITINKSAASLTAAEKRQAFMNSVLEEGTRKFGGIGEKVDEFDAYTRLAASGVDLFNSVMGTVANTIAPVAEFFSDNKFLLASAVVLYASTIKDDLLPALSEAGDRQREFIKISQEANLASAKEFGKQAEALNKAQAQAVNKTAKPLDSRAGSIVKELATDMENGEASASKFRGALAGLTEEYDTTVSTLERTRSKNQDYIEGLKANADIQRDAIERTRSLASGYHQQEAAVSSLNAITEAQNATFGNLGSTVSSVSKNLRTQFNELQTASGYANAGLTGVQARYAGFTSTVGNGLSVIGTGAKAAGAAFLNFLPIIGQVMFAFGLLTTAWELLKDLFTTNEQKEYNKVQEEFNSILAGSVDRMREYNRLQGQSHSSSSAQIDALLLTGNAVKELTDKYEELIEARKAAADSSLSDKLKAIISGSNTSEPDFIQNARRQAANSADYWVGGTQQRLDAIVGLYGVVNKANKQFIEEQTEAAMQIDSVTGRQAALDDISKQLQERFDTLSISTDNLRESYKNLEKSSTQFIQSASISTPVDQLFKDLTSVTSAIENLRIETLKGAVSVEDYSNAIADIGQNSTALTGSTAVSLSNLRRMRVELEGLEGAERLTKLRQIEDITASIGSSMQDQILKTKDLVRQNQIKYRNLENQASIQNAIYKKINDQLTVGAEGYFARIKHEESMRDLKVQELNLQQQLLKVFQATQEAVINSLELEKTRLEAKLLELETERKITEQYASRQKLMAEGRNMLPSDFANSFLNQIKPKENLDIEIAVLTQNIESARAAATELGDSIQALEAQKAAILAENLSAAEKAARAMGEEFKVAKEFLQQLNDYADTIIKNNRTIDSFNRLLVIRNNQIGASLNSILETYEDTRESLSQQLAIKAKEAMISNNITKAVKESNSINEQEAAAMQRTLGVTSAQYENEKKKTEALFIQAELKAKLEILELAIFDATKEGIEWQQKGLDLLERESDLTATILEKRRELEASRRATSRVLSGIPETDQTGKNEAIETARAALESAKAQASLRVSAIDAEYALMHAQKIALEQELLARRQILAAMGVTDAYLAPLDNAVKTLQSVNVSALRDLAVEGVKLDIQVAEQNLIESIARGTKIGMIEGPLGDFLAYQRDQRDLGTVLSKANKELGRTVVVESNTVLAKTLETGIEPLAHQQAEMLKAYAEARSPVEDIRDNVRRIADELTGPGAISGNARSAADYANSQGFRVSEGPGYGGVQSQHTGAGHREGRAYDINIGRGNTEADIPNMKARMDALAKKYQDSGFLVIWNRKKYMPNGDILPYRSSDHDNHLHVEQPAGHYSNRPTVAPDTSRETPLNQGSGIVPDVNTIQSNIKNNNPSKLSGLAGLGQGIKDELIVLSDFEIQLKSISVILREMEQMNPWFKLSAGLREFSVEFDIASRELMELAAKLGPEGALITAMQQGISGFSTNVANAIDTFRIPMEEWDSKTQEIAAKVSAVGSVVSGVLQNIAQMSQASADTRIAAIDQEIAAEQKRDGKSLDSQKKIEALEKKKDQIARKQFNTNKKLMMAEAIIATATGMAKALSMGPIIGPIMAAVIGAMGAAQIAIISGTSYAGGSGTDPSKAASPQKLTIGRIGSSVNLDRSNPNAGGEIGYLRGTPGYGSTAANYQTIGSAYGGSSLRGYGHRAFLTGEKGPEYIETSEPMTISPKTEVQKSEGDNFYITALDSKSVEELLETNAASIAKGLRKAANSSGQSFLEDVDFKSFGGRKR